VLITWLSEMVLGARSPETGSAAPPPKIQSSERSAVSRPDAAQPLIVAESAATRR
jgi:hypothetical protein